jgi:hypothetical protein
MLATSSFALALICLYYLGFVPAGLGAFGAALPFNGWFWAPTLTIASTSTLAGMIWIKHVLLLRYGAFVSFLMWVLGGMAFVLSNAVALAAVMALPWALFYAYVYLASFFREQTGI